MLALYFDIDFIRKFTLRTELESEAVSDFYNNFLKRIRGVDVFINLLDLDQVKELIQSNIFFHYLSEINPAIKLVDFKSKLNDDLFNFGQPTKIFFIEGCDENKLQINTNYIFLSNETFEQKWQLFYSNNDNHELLIKSNPSKNEEYVFSSWQDLKNIAHLTRNILVFDLYILANRTNQKISDNIVPCLLQLIGNNNPQNIEIKIFTKFLPNLNDSEFWIQEEVFETFKKLSILNEKVKKLSLVKYDKTRIKNNRTDIEHNRYILTNYFIIRVEAGFNIFKQRGGVNHGDTIRFDSILKNSVRKIVHEKISNLGEYCSALPYSDYRGVGPGETIEHLFYYPKQKLEPFK